MGSEWEVTPTNLLDVRLSLIFLRIWGWWPSEDWTPLQRALYRCQTAFSLGILLLFMLSEVLALFERGKPVEAHIGNACMLIEFVVAILKVVILEVNRIPMTKLISRLSSMHVLHGGGVPQQVEILKRAAWKGNVTTGLYIVLCSSTCIVWFVYPFIYVALTEDLCSLSPGAHSELPISISTQHTSSNETNITMMNLRTESKKRLLPVESNLEGILGVNSNINSSLEWNNDYLKVKGTRAGSNTHQQYPTEKCVPPLLFPADSWFPFDTTRDPGYKIAYGFQVLGIHIGCMYGACPHTLYATMFIYITGQLKLLNMSIKNVRKMIREAHSPRRNSTRRFHLSGHTSERDPQLNADWTGNRTLTLRSSGDVERRTEDALIACIKHHQDIISTVSELQSMISLSLLLQVVNSMCITCLTLYSAVVGARDSATTLKFTSYLMAMFAELFLICWFADDIIWESLEVKNSAFGCDWPDGSRTFKQKILMLILRAQKPIVITAGKFYVMSRSTYLQIVQASYSFFTVLSNVKDP